MVIKGESGGRDKLGVWVQQIHTTIYKVGKQEGPTVGNAKEYENIYIYI